MGAFKCSSPTRRMTRSKCACSAVAAAIVVAVTMLVNLVALSGSFSPAPFITNRWEVVSVSRLIYKDLPNTLSRIQRSAALRIFNSDEVNNHADFTDEHFIGTVEDEYDRIISSQKWLRQRVSWEEKDFGKSPEEPDNSQQLTVTICSAPPAFTGNESDLHRQALLSWLHLSPRPQIVLLGNHASLHKVAEEFPGLVSVEANIDYSHTGIPLFNSMVARANAVDTNVTVLIQPSVILLQDFMPGLRKLAGTFGDWALVSQRLGIVELPFRFVHKGGGIVFLEHSVTRESMIDRELANYVQSSGKLELLEGVNMWAWNVGRKSRLFAPPMPSFTYGAGYHDQWMARGFAKGSRVVVDVTDALVGFHSVQAQPSSLVNHTETKSWELAVKEWQNIANLYLYQEHGEIWAEGEERLSGGWKLIACPEIKLCVNETHIATISCRCGNDVLLPLFGTRHAETSLETEFLGLAGTPSPAPGLSPEIFLSLDELLPNVADAMKNVVLVGVNYADRDMILSFMCRARSLGVNNVLVAAFDKSVYKFAFVQGLPAYYAPLSEQLLNGADFTNDTCDMPSTCSQQNTKLKLQTILQVLQKGFNVLWSDGDVIWFKNPLSHLAAYAADVLVIESDEPNMNLPANGLGRANSGFFYARAKKLIIEGFEEIMRHARNSIQPEQLLFNLVLCGEQGQYRIDVTGCKAMNGLQTTFLDRRIFSNGIVNGYWWHSNVTQICVNGGVYVLHNNWIKGEENKVRRQKAKQVWFYNDSERMCSQPWQDTLGRSNNSQPTHSAEPIDVGRGL